MSAKRNERMKLTLSTRWQTAQTAAATNKHNNSKLQHERAKQLCETIKIM